MTQINSYNSIGHEQDTYTSQNNSKQNNSKSHQLKCGSLNVCSIRRKLLYPEFRELINDYDLFCVTETKLDSYDIVDVPSYNFISQCRRQKVLRKSGGIGVFVKDSISQYIILIDSESDYIMWFKLSKAFFKAEEDLIFGVVYLPPTDSRFNNPDELELFETEITNMSILHKYIFLVGNFNSRTQTQQEFIDSDDFFSEHFGYDDTLDQFYNISSLLTQYNLESTRSSEDKILNNEGKLLIDIYKSNGCILFTPATLIELILNIAQISMG